MINGKTILVFSPINKGWGCSTTAVALGTMLEQETKGRILIMDFFTEVSAIECYLRKDMSKNQGSMPIEIFMNGFNGEKLMLFCRPISPKLYFLKANFEKIPDVKNRRRGLNQIIDEAKKIFDIIIIKTDSGLAREIEPGWDVGISVSSYESGLEKLLEKESSFSWYRTILAKENCLKVVNGIPYGNEIRESLKAYITGKERVYPLPFNEELIVGGNVGFRLYSGLREEIMDNKSLYTKKLGKVTRRIMEVAGL